VSAPAPIAPSPTPPGSVSADFLLFLDRWYAATSKGGYGYQKKQEPGR
jgi:multimeric flavodoxin WrbA